MTKPVFKQNNKRNAYVYAIKVDGVVRIIGKGTNGRVHDYMSAMRGIARGTRKCKGIVQRKLYAAYKDGAKITHEFVERELTHSQAFNREAVLIDDYNERFRGQLWNVVPGGGGFNPSMLTPQALAVLKAIASEASKRRWDALDARAVHSAKVSAALLEFYFDPAVCEAHAAHMRERFRNDPEWRRKQRTASQRNHANPLVRQRCSESNKAYWAANPEALAQRTAALVLTLANPEVRKRRSEARKLWWTDPANRERVTAIIAAAMTPEVRKRAGASLSKTLMTDGPVRTRHLAHIDRLAKDKAMQRRKGAKLSRTLRDNPELVQQRRDTFMLTFNTPKHQRGFRARLKAMHNDAELQARRLASVRRAHKDPAKEARRLAGLRAYYAKRRAAKASAAQVTET
jgi:hypothetical protein